MTDSPSLQNFLERRQIPIYLAGMLAGLPAGWLLPAPASMEAILNPALALMMFATFLQIPLARLPQALRQGRFLCALLLANFVFVPLLAWLLLPMAPADPHIRFAIALVLLAPCIDYVVVFSHLGKADARLLLAATPVLLIAQMLALPVLLHYVFGIGIGVAAALDPEPVVRAFAWIVALPLLAAFLAQSAEKRFRPAHAAFQRLALLPVPATALVLFIVIAIALPQAGAALQFAWRIVLVYAIYAALAPLAGWAAARMLALPVQQQRSVAFSAATRNSLVVLPVAVAIPEAGPLVASVIVMQTLVELVSELLYIRWVPRLIRQRQD